VLNGSILIVTMSNFYIAMLGVVMLNVMRVFVVKLYVMVSHIVLLCCIIRLVGIMRSGS